MSREVECPACGGLIVADDDAELVEAARAHTIDAHGYAVPAEHVLAAAVEGPQ
jgi:predicted small metal-binding protein